jgi:hypothetical protein
MSMVVGVAVIGLFVLGALLLRWIGRGRPRAPPDRQPGRSRLADGLRATAKLTGARQGMHAQDSAYQIASI